MNEEASPTPRRLSNGFITSYGFGSIAFGVKDAGFSTFLLIYYNQVLGINAGTVGLIVMCALLFDAFIDPMIGVLSDRTRSKLGRRHPWMYASALPIAIAWLLLWNPPETSESLELVWLFVTAVLVRSAISCFEVPSQALMPELTQDYDERTRITAFRFLFGWLGGLVILVLAYGVFLVPSEQYPDGLTNATGYKKLALVSAGIMVVSILISALGTQKRARHFTKARDEPLSVKNTVRELWDTLHNRAFVILILAGLCAYTILGIGYALATYFYNYVWQLDRAELALLPLILFVGTLAAFVMAPRVARLTSKPRAAGGFMIAAMCLQTSPYWLRFAGVMPEPESPLLVPILFTIYAVATSVSVSWSILAASMMADVVEDSQMRTGRRNEGVFYSGFFFIQKCTSGIGVGAAGLLLILADFPADAKQGLVPVAALDHLTLLFILTYAVLACAAAFLFWRFPFGRAEHETRVALIAATNNTAANN